MFLIHRLLWVVVVAAASLLVGVGVIVLPATALFGWLALGLLVGSPRRRQRQDRSRSGRCW